jgi:hypothetical protein
MSGVGSKPDPSPMFFTLLKNALKLPGCRAYGLPRAATRPRTSRSLQACSACCCCHQYAPGCGPTRTTLEQSIGCGGGRKASSLGLCNDDKPPPPPHQPVFHSFGLLRTRPSSSRSASARFSSSARLRAFSSCCASNQRSPGCWKIGTMLAMSMPR